MHTDSPRFENELFEDEVRRIARELWPEAGGGGAKKIGGREYDGYFETDECIHLLEATTSRKKAKAEKDCKKLEKLGKKISTQRMAKVVVRWFVTRDEPTVDQREVATKCEVKALSFSQFQNQLIDSKNYLTLRDKHHFGSVRDPATGDLDTDIDYIPIDALDRESKQAWSVDDLASAIAEGAGFVLLGDFGAGKSMTLREIYTNLRKLHFSGRSSKFPVYINLREHWAQPDPVEILERHARLIGYPQPHHLVRAWRSGFAILLLDGFDELASSGIQGVWKRLRKIRFRTMQPLRKFLRNRPKETGLILSGRAHYFDSADERSSALSLSTRKPKTREVTLSEFTDEQVQEYLNKAGIEADVPDWMPTRPLLVGYLASRGLLQDIVESEAGRAESAAVGWHELLDRIASREAETESGIDASSIRRILERLASFARSTSNGRGPIRHAELEKAFFEVCFYDPDEGGLLILQRLPGLGIQPEEPGSRMFIDEDFADACKAGDLYTLLAEPYLIPNDLLESVETTIGALGIAVAVHRAKGASMTSGNIVGAIRRIRECTPHYNHEADIFRVALGLEETTGERISIHDVMLDELCIDTRRHGALEDVSFEECLIERLEIIAIENDRLPEFKDCYIEMLEGPMSIREEIIASNMVSDVSTTDLTTDALLDKNLPTPVNVLLTILKKLFRQSGAGRQEAALSRGLDHRAARHVPDIISILQQQEFIFLIRRRGNRVWVPNGSMAERANKILDAPEGSRDLVVTKCESL